MFASKHRITSLLLVAVVALAVTLPGTGQERVRDGGRAQKSVSGVFKSADAAASTITITVTVAQERGGEVRREAPATEDKTFSLAKNVEVVVSSRGGVRGGRGGGDGLFKEVKLADVAAGAMVFLSLAADDKTVDTVVAEGPTLRGLIKAVDATKNSITIAQPSRGGRGGEVEAGEEKTYTLAPDADLAVDDGRGGRFAVKEAKLADIAQGALVTARLAVNLNQIQSLTAEGPSYQGTIKAIDAAKKTLTLVGRSAGRGDDAGEEHALTVSPDAVILLDDGCGRRLSVKEGKLADVPAGAAAAVKLSVDQSLVMQIRIEGPTLAGQLKAVDAEKRIITIAIPRGRGDEPEEKSLPVAKTARVNIDGADSNLANLKAGDDSLLVQLRLSLDQKTVVSVSAHKNARR